MSRLARVLWAFFDDDVGGADVYAPAVITATDAAFVDVIDGRVVVTLFDSAVVVSVASSLGVVVIEDARATLAVDDARAIVFPEVLP